MIKITPSNLMTISTTLCLALAAHTSAHAQADATGAGFKRGTWKYQMGSPPNEQPRQNPAGFTTLMENVPLASSSGAQASDVVAFGPYINNSEYPLTLTLNPIGNGRRKQAVIFIGNTEMIRAHDEPISYTIPAKARYSFHVQNERAITAMVPVGADKVSLAQLGLPTAAQFSNPMPIGTYMGCVDSWRSSWNSPSEGAPFVWAQDFIATYYYYAMGGWSDGSAHGYRDRAVSTANNAPVMLGPQQPGPCVERGKEPQPAAEPGQSGPESRSHNRGKKVQ
jgi:hypothetical protein